MQLYTRHRKQASGSIRVWTRPEESSQGPVADLLLSACLIQGLEEDTQHCQELSLRAPVLRPGAPGLSDSDMCGGRIYATFPGTLADSAAVGWLLSLPSHTNLQRVLISTSQQFSSSLLQQSTVQYIYPPWQAGAFWRN